MKIKDRDNLLIEHSASVVPPSMTDLF